MLDVNNICRICLREEDPKLPIFTENGEKTDSKPTLPEKIMSFAQVKVAKDDGLPTFICVKCYCQVDETVEFIKLCEESFQFVTRQLARYVKHKEQENLLNAQVSKTSPSKQPNHNDHSMNGTDSPNKSTEKSFETSRNSLEKDGEVDGLPTLQITSTAGNVPAWSEEPERIFEVDTSIVKTEPNWEGYDSNDERIDVDGYDSNEENMAFNNFLDNDIERPEDESFEGDESSLNASVTVTPRSEKVAYRCKTCQMNFRNRKEMGNHITSVHRRCSTCGKYFFSNKHKDDHVCTRSEGNKPSFTKSQFCKICQMNVRHMRQHRSSLKHKEAIAVMRTLAMRKSLEDRRKNKELAKIAEKNEDTLEADSSTADTSKVDTSVADTSVADTSVADTSAADTSAADTSVANNSLNVSYDTSGDNEKVVCHLCNLVCINQRGFKTHMTCMHRSHKIVYYCKQCNNRVFRNRVVIEKHIIDEHDRVGLDNIPFEFKPAKEIKVVDIEDTPDSPPDPPEMRKRRGVPINKFECSYCGIKYLNFAECQDHLLQVHKNSNAQKIRILTEYVDEKISPTKDKENNTKAHNHTNSAKMNGHASMHEKRVVKAEDDKARQQPRKIQKVENTNRQDSKTLSTFKKPSLPTSPTPVKRKYLRTHPPFNSKMPVVANNFSIVLDDFGVKEYRCNGCDSTYNRYISAYNHYYTLSKKFPMVEKKQLPDSKPFGCKICTMKFASRGQAVSHRLNAHKLFYSQLKAARRNKLLAQAETEADLEVIEERLKEF